MPLILLVLIILRFQQALLSNETVSNTSQSRSSQVPQTCNSNVYCHGKMLHVIQSSLVYSDSKTFVDMSMKHRPEKVLSDFEELMKRKNNSLTAHVIDDFIDQHFDKANLISWTPPDFKEKPDFLKAINNNKLREYAVKVVYLWTRLGRRINEGVRKNPDMHSLIYVPNGFIVPGGRFAEYYYWDCYWIIQGLLLSEMYQTAKGMLNNILHLLKQYGFVPNGGRVYYLNRSQPPLLMKMATDYVRETNDTEWLKANIYLLETELNWWRNKQFMFVKSHNGDYDVATYTTKSLGPRPESYAEDIRTANFYKAEGEKQNLYNELKSAAQSGWDFSSRWIFDKASGPYSNISSTKTSRVIPVDLNAILCRAFFDISKFFGEIGERDNEAKWRKEGDKLKTAIQKLFWDEEDGIWYDYDREVGNHNKMFSCSNFFPLWLNTYDESQKEHIGTKVVNYIESEELKKFKGGIPATKVKSGENWDMPNAFANLQHVIVHGLINTGLPDAMGMAKEFTSTWITITYKGFRKGKYVGLFDKYDTEEAGEYGSGGEYRHQLGFGWTNGVVLDFIHIYHTVLGTGGVIKMFWMLNFVPLCVCITNFVYFGNCVE